MIWGKHLENAKLYIFFLCRNLLLDCLHLLIKLHLYWWLVANRSGKRWQSLLPWCQMRWQRFANYVTGLFANVQCEYHFITFRICSHIFDIPACWLAFASSTNMLVKLSNLCHILVIFFFFIRSTYLLRWLLKSVGGSWPSPQRASKSSIHRLRHLFCLWST